LNGKVVKLFESVLTGIGSKEKPGTIISVSKKGIEVSTTDLNLLLTKIQIAGKKPVSVEQMVNGNHAFKVGDMFL
jgi:methionyl-tRNA formyltransferase